MEPEKLDANLESVDKTTSPKKISNETILFLVVVIVIGIANWTALFFQKFYRVETPLIAENQTSDWKTYTNTEYGFEFQYPQGYKFSENTVFDVGDKMSKFEILVDKEIDPHNRLGFFKVLIRNDSMKFEIDWFKNNFENVSAKQEKIGISDFIVVSFNNRIGVWSEVAFIEHKKLLYIIDYNHESKSFLNSFKFTK